MADLAKVAEVFGEDAANRLAMWAIDALCEPPERIATGTTKLPASLVEEGRAILDDAGLDWRKAHRNIVERRRELRQKAYEARTA